MTDDKQQELDWLRWYYAHLQIYICKHFDQLTAGRGISYRRYLIEYYEGPYGNGKGKKVPDKYKNPDYYYHGCGKY